MAQGQRENKVITSKRILVIRRDETDRGISEIRVIEWGVSGKRYRNLEKRELYMSKDGEERMAKAKGFNGVDFLLITKPEIAEKIKAALYIAPEKKDYAPGHGSAEEESAPAEQEELI